MDKKKCIYCENKERARGFCNTCLSHLYRKEANVGNIDECIKILKERDARKKKDKFCIYCGEKVHVRDFCKAHYNYLKDKRCYKEWDVEECLNLLEERDEKKNRKCLFCGEKHLAKGFCKRHYQYLHVRGCDLDNTEKCLEVLEGYYGDESRGY